MSVPATGAALQGAFASRLAAGAAEVVGLALLAGGLAAGVAVVYRWYARERVPGGLAVLVGLSGVAVAVGATSALRQVIGDPGNGIDETAVLVNVATLLASALAARGGIGVGDRVGTDVFVATGGREVEAEVGRIVQAVGRVITVELPEEVDDIVGYDPVPDETKAQLAGRSFVFPRRLTVAELRDRLATRLKADYAVGHVDLDLAEDGTVEYIGVGSRAAGIGPTLPPETSAVAVHADPAFAASAGDLVQVWRTDPAERVLTAELRGTVDDVVTLAVDAADTRKLADDTEYRLVTLPVETRPDREFASVLRAAAETMAAVRVGSDSPIAGQPVGALAVAVVAVRPSDGPVEALPSRDRRLAPGDSVYVVATPDAIRRLEASVGGGAAPGSAMPPDDRVDAATAVADESDPDPDPATTDDDTPEEPPSATGTDADADPLEESGVPAIQALEPDEADDTESGDPTVATDDETVATDAEATLNLGDPDLSPLDPEATDEDRNGEADGPSGGVEEESDEVADGTGDTGTDADSPGTDGSPEEETDSPDDAEEAADGPTDDADAEDAGDGEFDDEWVTVDDPTREDLSELPGVDPDDLTGADVDALGDEDEDAAADESAERDGG